MRVTIKDISQASGFSPSTVSRVLAGRDLVKRETVDKIMDCAVRLGYVWKTGHSKRSADKVLIIVGDIMNAFYMGIVQGVTMLLQQEDIKAAIFNSNHSSDLEEEFVRYGYAEGYGGIIMLTAVETPRLVTLLRESACPVVLVNRFLRSVDLSSVSIDNFRGGYIATEYLLRKGHRRIAHLSGPRNSTASADRLNGYLAALEDGGVKFSNRWLYQGDLKLESGADFAEYYIKELRECTAVFSANDIMGAGFVQQLKTHDLHVPEDISLICFDNTVLATEGPVKMTTVSEDPIVMGKTTAEILMDIMNSKSGRPRRVVFSPKLIERASVLDVKM